MMSSSYARRVTGPDVTSPKVTKSDLLARSTGGRPLGYLFVEIFCIMRIPISFFSLAEGIKRKLWLRSGRLYDVPSKEEETGKCDCVLQR